MQAQDWTNDETLSICNLNRKTLPGPRFLDEVIDLRTQDQLAIEYHDIHGQIQSWTYKDLLKSAERLSTLLQQHLNGRKGTVPVIIPQHPALYISYQAVLSLGAAFCPIAPDTPTQRLEFIIQDVGATVVLCLPGMEADLQARLSSVSCLVVDLEALKDAKAPKTTTADYERDPKETAYVLYTSGSTGQPKGVPISHEAVCQSLLAHDCHLPHYERLLQFAAPTFDVSLFEIFFTFYRASQLICLPKEAILADLCGSINDCQIDAIELTPTIATTLLGSRSTIPNLRMLLTIGEMLTPFVVKEFGGAENQESILYAMYGPTEAAIHCTVVSKMQAKDSVRNIGLPFSTVTTLIVSPEEGSTQTCVLPKGQKGELALAGQLAHGYLNRPEQTSKAFIEIPGIGAVYRTGDSASMAFDGTVQIFGRISTGQVKLRGQRIELGEVEYAALQADGAQVAVALVTSEMLLLFVAGSNALQKSSIVRQCQSWLPTHMQPTEVIVLPDGMPRLPSGKIDRKLLESKYSEFVIDDQSHDEIELSATEKVVSNCLYCLLERSVDKNSSLRLCGVDSLRAIKFASLLREHYPRIRVAHIVENDSIALLSEMLDSVDFQTKANPEQNRFLPLKSASISLSIIECSKLPELGGDLVDDRVWPCSPIQSAMLTETLSDPKLNYNNITIVLRSGLTFKDFSQALSSVAEKNAILRAAFVLTENPDIPFGYLIKKQCDFRMPLSLLNPLQLCPGETKDVIHVGIHHALYDGWAWDLVMHDLNEALSGREPTQRPSFNEIVAASSSEMEALGARDFTAWTPHLQNFERTILPYTNTQITSSPGRRQYARTFEIHATALRQLSEELAVSRPSLLHSAWIILLAEMVGISNITTGLVVTNRQALPGEATEIVGPCFSTLPVLTNLGRRQTLQDVIESVYQAHKLCMKHPNVTLGQLKKAMGDIEARAPFDVLFVWQESLYSKPDPEAKATVQAQHDSLPYPLVIEVEPATECIKVALTYDTEMFCERQIISLCQQWQYLFDKIVSDTASTLDSIWMDLPVENSAICLQSEVSNGDCDITKNLAKVATSDPDRTALEFVRDFNPYSKEIIIERLTYGALYRRALHTASKLVRNHGLLADDVVAIQCTKSTDVYVLLCALQCAGIAYLCIDVSTPTQRTLTMIEEARAKIFVTDDQNNKSEQDCSTVTTLQISQATSRSEDDIDFEPLPYGAQSLAYVVFTSGSTGTPKGVKITRSNLLSNLEVLSDLYPHDAASKLLQSCTLSFDVSCFEIFWTWHCGMTLCSADKDVMFRDFDSVIDTLQVTHLSMTSSVASLIDPDKVPYVRFLVCAGEPLSNFVYARWAGRGLWQGYGPCETTNICNVRPCSKNSVPVNNVGPVFSNTSVFVCRPLPTDTKGKALSQDSFEILPKGALGEIWIGGAQVGPGYTDPKRTAESYCWHPVYGWLYRSGDLGRLLLDDSLAICGRLDDQVKLRGQRIELGEINIATINMNIIKDAYTIVVNSPEIGERLVLFCVLASQMPHLASAEEEALRKHLSATLPTYMMPDHIMGLSALPITTNAKVDKKQLIEEFTSFLAIDTNQLSHGTLKSRQDLGSTHLLIIKAISSLLKIPEEKINIHTPFLAMGIDSIKAIGLVRELRTQGIRSTDVSHILRYRSVDMLSEFCNSQNLEAAEYTPISHSGAASTSLSAEIKSSVYTACSSRKLQIKKILPCTSLQEAMLADSFAEGNSYQNHIVYALRVAPETFKAAWSEMVKRHDLLRTFFAATDSIARPFVQAILEHHELPWYTAAEKDPSLPSPFEAPPYALKIEKMDKESPAKLHLFMHHALYDAEGLSVLQNEIEDFCRGNVLPDPIQFDRYLDYMFSLDAQETDIFWSSKLRGSHPCRFGEMSRLSNQIVASNLRIETDPLPYSSIRDFATSASTSVLSVMQTALIRLIHCYCRQRDIIFGSVLSGRNIAALDMSTIVGPCFNTLPVRARISDSMTNLDLCKTLSDYNIDILSYQTTPLRQALKSVGGQVNAMFDVLLLLQAPSQKLDSNIWEVISETGHMEFPFIFEAVPQEDTDKLELTIHCSQEGWLDLQDLVMAHFSLFLRDTLEHPHRLAKDCLDIISPVAETSRERQKDTSLLMGSSMQDPRFTEVKDIVLEVLSQLSGHQMDKISLKTTIFRLGFDSISVMNLVTQMRNRAIHLKPAEVLKHPQVAQIVQLVLSQTSMSNTEDTYDLDSFDREFSKSIGAPGADVQRVLPCTSTQIGILSKARQGLYFNTISVDLGIALEPVRMKQALCQITRQHPILRTSFSETKSRQHPFVMFIYEKSLADRFALLEQDNAPPLRNLEAPHWRARIEQRDARSVVTMTMCHALYDAHSLSQILQDLHNAYHGLGVQEPVPIEPTLARIVKLNQCDKYAKEFWSIKHKAQKTSFPNLHIVRDPGAEHRSVLNTCRKSYDDIRKNCTKLGVTLSVAVQAAWTRLLASYTGQDQVTFGNVFSGRTFEDPTINDAAIPCINTLPIIVPVSSSNESLGTYLQDYNAELQQNPHMSQALFAKTLEASETLFDTIISLHENSSSYTKGNAWQIVFEESTAEYAVSLEVLPIKDRVDLVLTFSTERLPVDHGGIILAQFEHLLYDFLQLTNNKGEDSRIIASLPATLCEFPSTADTLHGQVLEGAQRYSDRIAIETILSRRGRSFEKKCFTYCDLISMATNVAVRLQESGATLGDRVALCFEKSAEASISLLGILMAGCAYVAIDPAAPSDRQSFLMTDSGCTAIVTSSELAHKFHMEATVKKIIVGLDELEEKIGNVQTTNLPLVPSDDVCYCLYTSGTTGTPKGCLISHRSAVQAMCSFSEIFEGHWTASSRWLQFAAYHFDVSVLEHFWSWKEGLTVVIVPRDVLFEDLAGTMNELAITHVDLTPSLARMISPDTVPTLEDGVFIVGGEQVRQDILEAWGDAGCLYNFYGPSEVTIGCTVHPRVKSNIKPTNIGHQWSNVGTRVLFPGSESPVLRGGIGELCLSGVLVGQGYLGRPDLTKQKFVHLDNTGERIYRTGDLVRMLHDGSFEFLGRLDDQVKLRGQRLEIGEIDHVLAANKSEFEEVVTVVAKRGEQDKEQLVTFLSLQSAGSHNNGRLVLVPAESYTQQILTMKSQAAKRLPAYMVPSQFLVIRSLPLTVNNKVDVKALKAFFADTSLDQLRSSSPKSVDFTPEQIKVLSLLSSCFAAYLSIDPASVKPEMSLYQFGLDSVSVIGLAKILREEGLTGATVQKLLELHIVRDLAVYLSNKTESSDTDESNRSRAVEFMKDFSSTHQAPLSLTFGIDSSNISCVAPCTPLQTGMIAKLSETSETHYQYLTKFIMKLDRSIDLETLVQTWQSVVEQRAIFRTCFLPTVDGYAQVVLSKLRIEDHVRISQVTKNPQQLIEEYFLDWTRETRLLGSKPPWQVLLQKDDDSDENFMGLFMFHGLYDGPSMNILHATLSNFYYQTDASKKPAAQFHEALPCGPLGIGQDSSEFWRSFLRHSSPLFSEDKNAHETVKSLHISISASAVTEMLVRQSVTPQALFVAAWIYTLANHYNVLPCIGLVLAGRSIEFDGADTIIGPLLNTIPFTITEGDTKHPAKVVRQRIAESLPYQHCGVGAVRKSLGVSADKQLFDSLFVFNSAKYDDEISKPIWTHADSESTIQYPLNVEIHQFQDRFDLSITYRSGVVDGQVLLTAYQNMLKCFLEEQEVSLPQKVSSLLSAPTSQSQEQVSSGNALDEDRSATATEKIIIEIIAALSHVDISEIGLSRPNIFELGIDSVDALKMISRLSAQGISLPISTILREGTVTRIARAWEEIRDVKNSNKELDIQHELQNWRAVLPTEFDAHEPDTIETVFPVTAMQEGLLLDFEQYYHILLFDIGCSVEVDRMSEAVRETAQDIAVLRSYFFMLEDAKDGVNFLQIVQSSSKVTSIDRVNYEDQSELMEVLQRWKKQAKMDQVPPKIQLATVAGRNSYLAFGISHALYDGWSFQLILESIKARYHGNSSSTKAGSDSVAQHALISRVAASEERGAKFWKETLSEVKPTILPPSIEASGTRFHHSACSLSLNELSKLTKYYGITLQSLALTAWILTLAQATKQLDICFGYILSGRSDQDSENLAFPTFNNTIFRLSLEPNMSRGQLVRAVHEMSIRILEYQNFSLSSAQKLSGHSGKDLFNTLFTFQKNIGYTKDAEAEALRFQPVEVDSSDNSPPYAFNIEFEEQGNKLLMTVAVQQNFLSSDAVDKIMRTLDESFLTLSDLTEAEIRVKKLEGLQQHNLINGFQKETKTSRVSSQLDFNTNACDEDIDELKSIIRQAFSKISGEQVSDIGDDVGLFQLGLDSISAIRVSKHIRECQQRAPVSLILKGQTVAGIANLIASQKNLDSSAAKPQTSNGYFNREEIARRIPVERETVENIRRCTGGQEYMLDLWRASRGQLGMPVFWLQVTGCSRPTLQKAWDHIQRQHAVLRSRFWTQGNESYQIIFKEGYECPLPWSYRILDCDGELLLMLELHHALYDGISLERILRDVSVACGGEVTSATPANVFKEFLSLTTDLSRARDFWNNYLQPIRSLSDAKLTKGSFKSARSQIFKDKFIPLNDVMRLAKAANVSIQAVVFAVIGRLYSTQWTKHRQGAVVGVYLANRSLDIEGLAQAAEPVFNICPLRVDEHPSGQISDIAQQVQKDLSTIGQEAFCGTGIRAIHEWTGLQLDCNINFLPSESKDDIQYDQEVQVTHAQDIERAKRDMEAKYGKRKDGNQSWRADESVFLAGSEDSECKWCLPSLDIELRVDDETGVSVGMFAPEDMFTKPQLRSMMEELRAVFSSPNDDSHGGDE